MTRPVPGVHSLIELLKRRGIQDELVLDAIRVVDRKQFVPPSFASRAYDDIPLPISVGQTISQPTVVAVMTQELSIKPTNRVLEIGTGSGYQTAILSRLARYVYSIERFGLLASSAKRLLVDKLKLQNISLSLADGTRGLPKAAPFDRIMVTAASEDIPPALLQQLKNGGIMVLPIGSHDGDQNLVRVQKTESGLEYSDIFPVRFVPLLEGVDDA